VADVNYFCDRGAGFEGFGANFGGQFDEDGELGAGLKDSVFVWKGGRS
jgi:hypothetical protein